MKHRLRTALVSDVHLGHRRTPTEHIIRNLKQELPDTAALSDLDLIFISGDLFDRSLALHSNEAFEIASWLGYLLRTCKKRDIVLRVLEGTPSHDWKQSEMLHRLNEHIGADAKHVSTLSIEHIDRFGIDVLYVPDEWTTDTDETWKQVVALMAEHNLEQVDFVVNHGQYAYQLPPHVNVPTHDPERYTSITRHYVFTGHVHNTSRHLNIIVPGSFDRLSHNEEGPKGHYRITVDPSGDDSIVFVENKGAMIYKTIDCRGLSVDDSLEKVEHEIKDLPPGSHVRLQATTSDIVSSSIDVLRKRYPTLHWTSKVENNSRVSQEILTDKRGTYQTTPITPQTIHDLVEKQLIGLTQDETMISKCLKALGEVA